MSDVIVAEALDSDHGLVLVEAPAGFGKTFQATEYSSAITKALEDGRLLILTHTHAACTVIRSRLAKNSSRAEVRTIDSMIVEIARRYHASLGVDSDVHMWIQTHGADQGRKRLSRRVAIFLASNTNILSTLSQRYPHIIVDEHQDSSDQQHKIIMLLHQAGSTLRIFADPMQAIFPRGDEWGAWNARWEALKSIAGATVSLETPHRWRRANPQLGEWIKRARQVLQSGGTIDLTGTLPQGVTIMAVSLQAQSRKQLTVGNAERVQIDRLVSRSDKILILASQNDMVRALRSFFNRRLAIWEGHTRSSLDSLARSCHDHIGNASEIAAAVVTFIQSVAIGFSKSNGYSERLIQEVATRCVKPSRGKAGQIQLMAQYIIDSPDHIGAARSLQVLRDAMQFDQAFRTQIRLDLRDELNDAIRLAQFATVEEAIVTLSARRARSVRPIPDKAISTIHKAKGLEFPHVLVIPCDGAHFSDSPRNRRLLYVAMSRATDALTLVFNRADISPLFKLHLD